jgi:PIN domain nuclease of toxin-antitoxin system
MNRVLLDTCALIWLVQESDELSEDAREIIGDPSVEKYLSPVAYWELAIKIGDGDLTLSMEYCEFINWAIEEYGLKLLDIRLDHTDVVRTMRKIRKPREHKNPFDRLMIAQAMVEDLVFITDDWCMEYYGFVELVEAGSQLWSQPNYGGGSSIAFQGRPVAARKARQPGNCRGMLTIVSDDDEHLEHFKEYMP